MKNRRNFTLIELLVIEVISRQHVLAKITL